ncbi:minor tail protein [Arthrobacter phage Mimi]|nr:minor tail protein [Arthrobacter phage Mimi]
MQRPPSITSNESLLNYLKSLENRVNKVETKGTGTIGFVDEATGVETIIGALPDGTVGIQEFVNDITPPEQPSTPGVAAGISFLRVAWDGLDVLGGTPPKDYDRTIIEKSTDGVSDWVAVDEVYGNSASIIGNLPINAPTYFRLVSIDRNGNRSVPSATASGTPLFQSAETQALIDEAVQNAIDASNLASSKIKVYYQTASPALTGNTFGDLWFDTDAGNKVYLWNGSAWSSAQDTKIPALEDLASSKIKSYVQATSPALTGNTFGDTWYNTAEGNKIYVWTGSAWTSAQDAKIPAVESLASSKIKTYFQTAQPALTGNTFGDIWFDTDAGNKVHVWNGSAWFSAQDTKIPAIEELASSKIKSYFQSTSPALTGNTFGDTWYNTSEGNKIYIWNGSAWSSAQDAKIPAVESLASSKTKVYFQAASPALTGNTFGDTWFDTDDGNKPYVWTGSAWTNAQDQKIPAIESLASSKIRVYYQANSPALTGNTFGDTWFDTDDGNKPYVWTGSAWTNAQDQKIIAVDQVAASKTATFFQTSAPATTGRTKGDTWFDTDDGNRIWVWNGSAWTDAQDDAIAAAQQAAVDANNLASSKIKVYYQANSPALTGNTFGDTWFDTDAGNKPYVWNGSAWSSAQDASIAAANTLASSKTKTYYQSTSPALTGNIVGDTWFDTGNGNRISVWNGSAWTNAQDTAIAAANTLASSKIKVYYQSTSPALTGNTFGDTWFDTASGNKPYVWTGSTWTSAQDASIAAANTLASSKTRTYYQANSPALTGNTVGDTWFDTDAGNKIYVWNGSSWASAQDAAIVAANDLASSKIKVYFQTAQPAVTGNTFGDTWFDTDAGNKVYVWNGSAWTSAQDTSIATAQSTANSALTSANGKNKTYFQAASPALTGNVVGDTWFDTDDGNKIYVWNGSAWTDAQDDAITAAQQAANTAIQNAATADSKAVSATNIANSKNVILSAASAPATAGRIAGDTWFDTANGNKPYTFNGTSWVSVQDASIATAQGQANTALTTANGKTKTFITGTQPTATTVGDIWIDTANGNVIKTWEGSAWITRADAAIAAAQGTANTAVTNAATADSKAVSATNIANTKTKTYYQGTSPALTGNTAGDLWFDTSNGNKPYVWNGAWTSAQDASIATAQGQANTALTTANGKTKTFITGTQPTATTVGDIWIDTANGNVIKTWEGSSWVTRADAAIATAQSAANAAATAAATADGKAVTATNIANSKNVILSSASAPTSTGRVTGDTWFDTSNGNKPSVWNGTAWVSAQDASIASAQGTANTALTTANGKTKTFITGTQPTATTVGDIWIDTANGNVIKTWEGSSWVSRADTAIAAAQGAANTAISNAATADSKAVSATNIANSKNVIISSASAPATAGRVTGDTWFDTSNGNKPMVWNGSAWVSAQDASIATAQGTANSALTTANGKTKTYFQASSPALTGNVTGDIWFDTDDGNKVYVWNGSSWASARDSEISTALTSANGKNKTYYQAAQPSGGTYNTGDTWFDTDDNYKLYTYTGSVWQLAQDAIGAKDAAIAAAEAEVDRAFAASKTYLNPTSSMDDIQVLQGTPPTIVSSPTAAGGTAMQKTGAAHVWLHDNRAKQVFDPTALYRLSARVRVSASATNGGGRGFYWGFAGFAADGTTYVNAAGANSYSSQQWGIQNAQVPTDGNWVDYVTYVKGLSATTPTGAGTLSDPRKLHTDTRFVVPSMILDYSTGNGTWEVSHWSVDVVDDTAYQTAVSKSQSFYQTSMPSGGLYKTGDLWFDTDDGNKVYVHNGTTFVLAQDLDIQKSLSQAHTTDWDVNQPNKWAYTKYSKAISTGAPTYGDIAGLTGVTSLVPDATSIVSGQGDSYIGQIRTIVNVATTKTVSWTMTHDDGARVYVDGVSVYAGPVFTSNAAVSFSLTAGWHVIDIMWAEQAGGDGITAFTPLLNTQVTNMYAPVSLTDASATATTALTSANGKNKVIYSTSDASGTTGYVAGDTWFKKDASNVVIAQWEYSGSAWVSKTIGNTVIAALDAGKITSGYVDAARIQAGSVTADKLLIGDFTNLLDDPDFVTGTGWGIGGQASLAAISIGVEGQPTNALKMVANATTIDVINKNWITVQGGDRFYGEVWVKQDGNANTGNLHFGTTVQLADGTPAWPVFQQIACSTVPSGSSWLLIKGVAVMPTNAVKMVPRLSVRNDAVSGTIYFDRATVRRQNTAVTIADGTIQANSAIIANGAIGSAHIADLSVGTAEIADAAVKTAKIDDLAVTNAKIANATIDDAKIANLNAGKITAGTLDAARIGADTITGNHIAGGTITAAEMAAGSITASAIAAQSITATALAANSITATAIAADTITAGNIAAGAITGSELSAGSVSATAIAANSITATALAAQSITATALGAASITATALRAGAVSATAIAADTITAGQIASGAITAGELAAGSVTASAIAANSITATALAANSISATAIAADTITSGNIAAGAITSSELSVGSVSASALAANSITATALAANSITATAIAAGAISASAIAADTITSGQIASGAVTAAELSAGSITASALAANSITATALAAQSVSATAIASNTITAGQIAAGAITAGELAANSVTATAIKAGEVDATHLKANSITATAIGAGAISATAIAADTITAGQIATGAVTAGELAAGAVTASAIAANSITATALAAQSITATAIATDTITAGNIQAGAITGSELAAGSVSATAIAANSITATALAAQSITATALAAQSITATAIKANAITATAMAADSIRASAIRSGEITAAHLTAGLITASAMSAGSIKASALDVTVGGNQMVANSSFEVDSNGDGLADGWNTWARGAGDAGRVFTNTRVAGHFPGSVYAQRVESTTVTNTEQSSIQASQLFFINPGDKVTLSIYGRASVAGNFSVSLRCEDDLGAYKGDANFTAAFTTAVQRFSGVVTIPAGTTKAKVTVTTPGALTSGHWFEVDGIKAELGDVLSAWSPLSTELLPGTIVANMLAANAVTAASIAAGSITATALAAQSIGASAIKAGSITATAMAADSITASAIAAGAVTAQELAAGSITATAIAAGSITASALAAQSITATALGAQSISATAIGAGSITATALAAQSITATALAADSVTASAIRAGSVTADELAAGSVSATAIAANSITATALAAGSITATAIGAGSITASAIAAQSITATALGAQSVSATAIGAQSITATALAAQSITATALAAQSITASAIKSQSITATALAANSITATAIGAQQVTATKMLMTDMEELIPNPTFHPSGEPVTQGTVMLATSTPVSAGAPSAYVLKLSQRDTQPFSGVAGIPVKAGDQFYVEARVAAAATTTRVFNHYIFFSNSPTSGYSAVLSRSQAVTGTWTKHGFAFTVPSGYAYMKPYLQVETVGGDTVDKWEWYVANWSLRHQNTAELIVDGSIQGNHIKANNITASALAVGSITATALAAQSITATAMAAQSITATAIAAQSISATALAAQSITATAIAANSITASALAAGSITATAIGAGSITATAIGSQSITATALAAQSITATALAAQSIGASAIKAGSITATAMAADSITATAIAANAVTATELAAGSITATAIAANSITASALAAQSITATALAAGSITATAIAAQSITATALAAQSITATAIGAQSVGAEAIKAGSITATALAADSITATAIGAQQVTATELAAGSITATAIAAGSITASALAANSITATALAAGSVTASAIGANSITATALASESITATAIGAQQIGADKLIAQSITATALAAQSIGATALAAQSITATALGAQSITATAISAEAITASAIRAGAINATHLSANAITATAISASSLWADSSWLGVAGASQLKLVSSSAPSTALDPDGQLVENQTYSEINSQGFRVYNLATTSNAVSGNTVEEQKIIQLGTFDEDFFAINKAGVAQISMNADGKIAAQSLEIGTKDANAELKLNGIDLGPEIFMRPRGMMAWGQVPVNTNMSVASGGEIGLFEIAFDGMTEPARMYEFNVNNFLIDTGSAGTTGLRLRYTTNGTQPTISSPLIGFSYFRHETSGLTGTGHFTRLIGSNNGDYIRVLVSLYTGASWAKVYNGTGQNYLYSRVMDLGETIEPTAIASTAGGTPYTGTAYVPPAPAKVTKTVEWGYTGVRSYYNTSTTSGQAGGPFYNYNTGKAYQGLSPAGYGNLGSIYTFPNMTTTLSGSTINGVWIYVYFEHWYNGTGGKARIRLHGHTSPPSTYSLTTNGVDSASWPRGAGRWVALPSSLWDGFRTGTYEGFGLFGDGTYGTYGIANNARIRIKYTK